jgi:ribA/ribD-fused uncharacterized protein
MTEKFTFFYGGPFSQWYKAPFYVGGHTYNCAEQFMMASKASIFNDTETFDLIMAETNPRLQKALGREVKNFDPEKWDRIASAVVFNGNFYKFSQNADIKEILLRTAGTTIVEASPKDTIWGIGLAADDPRAQDRSQWLGKNRLGYVLTRLREHFLCQEQK